MFHFYSIKLVKKIHKVQQRALRIFYNDFCGDFESILKKSGTSTIKVKRLNTFKTLNYMNPEYMKEIFHNIAFSTHRPYKITPMILNTFSILIDPYSSDAVEI